MKKLLFSLLSVGAMVSCVSPKTPPPPNTTSHEHQEQSHSTHSNAEQTPYHVLSVPAATEPNSNQQVNVLLDSQHVKIVSIRLRNGAPLAEHQSAFPTVILAMSGSGAVILGQQRVQINSGQFVALSARVPHAVIPDPGSDLVLIVQHIRGAS